MANTKYKPIILISGLLVAALGGYYLYQTKFKKKEDEVEEEKAPTQVETAPTNSTPSPKASTNITPKPKVKAPVKETPRANPGFVQPPTGPQSVAVKTPKMGANLYVLTDGANAYKSAAASQNNIYKYYPKGAFVGTFLSKTGSFAKIIVEEKNLVGIRVNKEVFVPAKDIYVK